MTTVTFTEELGADPDLGLVFSDDANPDTGMKNDGYLTRFFKLVAQVLLVAAGVKSSADSAVVAAAAALGGATTIGTSTTTATIPAVGGTLTVTMQAGKTIVEGQRFVAAKVGAAATDSVYGTVTAYNEVSGSIAILAEEVNGQGNSVSSWELGPSAYGVPEGRSVSTSGLATGGGNLSASRTINVPAAVAADVLSRSEASKAWTSDAVWDALDAVAVAYGSTITLDLSAGCSFTTTFTGAPAIANPTNAKVGQSIVWEITVGSGGGQPTFGTKWKRQNSVATFSTTLGQKNVIEAVVLPSGDVLWDLARNPVV